MPDPIKRHPALQPLSREHHYGLLLSWKIRQGQSLNVSLDRIKKYTDWFWETQLEDHFIFEEKHIFPILGKDNNLVKRAIREHRNLKKYFTAPDELEKNLSLIEEAITAHIRFEERVLFAEIQRVANEHELLVIEEAHTQDPQEDWEDEFWVKPK